jgi:hypothetical protein
VRRISVRRTDDEIPWVSAIVLGMAGGLVGIIIYAWAVHSWVALGCALLIALAASVAGALTGFVFGIPKTTATASSSTAQGTVRATSEYQGNSNLEQISDWLAKILVGASLVQLGTIRDEFNAFGSRLDESGILGSGGWIVGPALVIAYSVSGFLIAYLWARIYMASELRDTDAAAITIETKDSSATVTATAPGTTSTAGETAPATGQ